MFLSLYDGSLSGKDLLQVSAPVTIFWSCTQVAQRLCGALRIQYGRRGSNLIGFLIVVAGSSITSYIQRKLVPVNSQSTSRRHLPRRDMVTVTYLSLISFIALGLKPFSSVLPSSVIMLGSFSKVPHYPIPGMKGSVPVSSEVASNNQRRLIQRLGKLYGCHHCGSKQLFSKCNFIADHMPPTAQVKIENSKWWRQLIGLNVSAIVLSYGYAE